MAQRHRVVVVGGGFAGVDLCLQLAGFACDVTLIDRRNFHLFQPLLYQVATGGLSPGDIAAPLRTVVKKAKNVVTVMADVTDLDVVKREVILKELAPIPYDTLVIATGVRHSYFGNDKWEKIAPGLKSLEDAVDIRRRVLNAFEQAEKCTDDRERDAWLRFVIVGGGPTGVELAGALGELAAHTMKGEFRNFDSDDARILLVEGSPRILSMYKPSLSEHGVRALQDVGVAVLVNTKVTNIDEGGVDVERKEGKERIEAKTVLWAAGVAASPLGKLLAEKTGAKTDRAGRVIVERDLTVPGHGEILVLGDLANFAHTEDKQPLPGVATVAMQMGRHAAAVIERRMLHPDAAAGSGPLFRFLDKGTMAVIGRNEAVARVGFGLNLSFGGFFAWCAWLFIHIMYLVGFENRLLVLLQWANHYFTRHRGARLITGG
ncbi:MAG: NAD(P)/FAD-dependent oxidoreductase [Deltaproteobacteria bacterium]|nr:NAD(P)/FAD-dependent oxidoreductase [Deltaproteobacteria bacterium]